MVAYARQGGALMGRRDGRSRDMLPRMDWYPQDYLADRRTRAMTLEEHGAYRLLLDSEWLDGPLPNDPKELAAILGVTPRVFNRLWRRVGECFEERDGRLVNPRLEREREVQLKIRADRRAAARKGGEARARRLTPEQRAEIARRGGVAKGKQQASTEQADGKQQASTGQADVLAKPLASCLPILAPSPSPSPSPSVEEGAAADWREPEDLIADLRGLHEAVTAEYAWVRESDSPGAHERRLRAVIDRYGAAKIRADFEAWVRAAANDPDESTHLGAFLARWEKRKRHDDPSWMDEGAS